ncbi:glycosyltransferase [Priestia flexa]|uniref:glycosyltransferase n=1 Tax=Priestia flexa TaxID=86664 RepID=UPI0013D486C0|nr:glycosyltransferase [Priestia flexa]
MKILHIGEYVSGGIATYLKELLKFQSKENNVYLVCSDYNSEQIQLNNVSVIRYENYKRSLKDGISYTLFLQKVIKNVKPDIIHIHSSFAGMFARLPLLILRKKYKVIYCAHGWSFSQNVSKFKKHIYALIEKTLVLRTDLIINISDYEQELALKYRISNKKMQTIYNGVRLPKYTKNFEPIDLSIVPNQINLLYLGRFDYAKGIDLVLEALKEDKNNVKLYLIGSSVLDDLNIDAFMKNNSSIHLIGWVDNDLIDNYYKIFDAIVIPSRWEGFGLVAIEAMRNKKAVICSNVGGLKEIVDDSVTGYKFDTLEELKEIIRNLDKTTLDKMGLQGYKKYIENYTVADMNKRVTDSYYN